MDRLVRARVLLAEAAALGVTIEDLIAESSGASSCPSTAPTVAEYVDTVRASFSKGTAGTYTSYWRLAIDRLGERTIASIGVDDCESVVADAVRTTSQDPDLDLLLIRFHLESGARREGALNLRLRDLDPRRSTVWLREKFGAEREQPVSPSLFRALETHTSAGGAIAADDPILRGRSGRPITRRRYNTVFDRARPCIPWSERTPVSAHILRHTAITAVERHAGFAVAQAFAGHSASSVTDTYTRARIGEVAAAVSALTGEVHPLAER